MEKKVSVIIPFYNGVDWLCEAVQSVLDQTYNNFEIIVVNDGSQENIDNFLEKYGDRITYRYKENEGAATARNLALSIASGDYIAFLDSDDIWLPTKTEKQIAFMEKIGAMWSHTGFYYWFPDKNELKVINNKFDYDNIYNQIFVSVKIATLCVIINRKILLDHPEINFPIEYRKAQDTKFFHAISKYYPIALIEEPLSKVRMRGNNSNLLAVLRFNLRAKEFILLKKSKENIPFMVLFIHSIYYFYSKIFGVKTNKVKEFIAKCFWALPFIIERIYLKYIIAINPKNKKYLLEFNKKI